MRLNKKKQKLKNQRTFNKARSAEISLCHKKQKLSKNWVKVSAWDRIFGTDKIIKWQEMLIFSYHSLRWLAVCQQLQLYQCCWDQLRRTIVQHLLQPSVNMPNNGLFLLGATDLNNNELSTFCNNACLLLQIGACESIPYINDYSVTHTQYN